MIDAEARDAPFRKKPVAHCFPPAGVAGLAKPSGGTSDVHPVSTRNGDIEHNLATKWGGAIGVTLNPGDRKQAAGATERSMAWRGLVLARVASCLDHGL
jgi:hypothetical protein